MLPNTSYKHHKNLHTNHKGWAYQDVGIWIWSIALGHFYYYFFEHFILNKWPKSVTPIQKQLKNKEMVALATVGVTESSL